MWIRCKEIKCRIRLVFLNFVINSNNSTKILLNIFTIFRFSGSCSVTWLKILLLLKNAWYLMTNREGDEWRHIFPKNHILTWIEYWEFKNKIAMTCFQDPSICQSNSKTSLKINRWWCSIVIQLMIPELLFPINVFLPRHMNKNVFILIFSK